MTKERPILFSGPMVRAILDGRKTQTRRLMKPQPRPGLRGDGSPCYGGGNAPDGLGDVYYVWEPRAGETIPLTEGCRYRWEERCPYGVIGDRLWVRETFYDDNGLRHVEPKPSSPDRHVYYRADGEPKWEADSGTPWRPSIHMPRWASRVDLEITAVRVEQLHDITEDDARAEGFPIDPVNGVPGVLRITDAQTGATTVHKVRTHDFTARGSFCHLWDGINGKRAPWSSNPWVWVISFKRVGQ